MKKNIVFRADSSNIIATGHIQRCINLANQFDKSLYNIFFICKSFEGNLINNIQKYYQVFIIDTNDINSENIDINDKSTWAGEHWKSDANKTINILIQIGKIDLLILDHYGLPIEWEMYIYLYVNKLCVLDDVYRSHYCHILQNQHIDDFYDDVNSECIQLLGNKYIILNKDIINIEPKKISELKRINISLGGGDIENHTLKIVNALMELPMIFILDVVVGKAYQYIDQLNDYCKNYKNINLYINLNNTDFLNLLNECDLSIGASGMTNYERCILNKPLIHYQLAENQDNLKKKLQDLNIGYFLGFKNTNYLSNLKTIITKYYNDPNNLLNISKNCHLFCNKNNIFNLKNTLEILI